jgi:hypothetical protein
MGMTNIHHERQILSRSGTEMTDQAQIMPFGKAVLLIGREFTQEEIKALTEVLHTPRLDVWYEYNSMKDPKPVTNDKGLPVPSVYTSPGLMQERGITGRFDEPKSASGVPIEFAYVIVVRGASGAMFSKVRVFYSLFAVAAGIMEDVLQGWSVVFSAAMLKGDVQKLGHVGVEFEKVGKLSELVNSMDEERAWTSVLLCC